MKKVTKALVFSAVVLTLALSCVEAVSAWGSMFNRKGSIQQMSKTVTGRTYQSNVGLRKTTDKPLRIQATLYKKEGSSYNGVKSEVATFEGTGVLNHLHVIDHNASGSNSYRGEWKQLDDGVMQSSLDISNSIPIVR